MVKCLYCSNETPNPKFCNSSCAAKHNNKKKCRNPNGVNGRGCINWKEIQDEYNSTKITTRELARKYGFSESSWTKAVKRGAITIAPSRLKKIQRILAGSGEHISRPILKRNLLESGILVEQCAECGQFPEWKGKKLVLILDHINGIWDDDRFENLRLLCPNCNSQTETFAGRRGKYKCVELIGVTAP